METKHEGRFQRLKESPQWWLNKASDLHASAGVLWLAMEKEQEQHLAIELGLGSGFDLQAACPSVFLMLYGMALELLFKAIIVASGDDPKFIHDLLKLADLAGVEFSEIESAEMEYMTQSICWDGRYPVPKSEDDYTSHYDRGMSIFLNSHPWEFGRIYLRSEQRMQWDSLEPMWCKGLERFKSCYESGE